MSLAPFIKPTKRRGSFFTFPSSGEDMSLTLTTGDNKGFRFSYFVLLNLPDILRPVYGENSIQLDAIPGAYPNVTGLNWNNMFAESFQNYALNLEKMITSSPDYDPAAGRTVSERVFFKWLKEIGAMRFREATPSETASLSVGKRFVEEDASGNYERVIRYIGEIDINNQVRHYGNSYSEVYLHIPTKDGYTPLVMFKSLEDANYAPSMFFQNNPTDATEEEYILGRGPGDTHPYALNFEAFFDSDTSSLSPDSLYTMYKKGDDETYSEGWWFTNPMDNTYFTEPTSFEDPTNDWLKIVGVEGSGKETEVEFQRSRLDGITLDFNLNNYRPAVDLSATDGWHFFNESDLASNFEFNAMLVYYDVFDTSNPDDYTTNLYGVLFFDKVEETSIGGGTIPRLDKYKPNAASGHNGNSYGMKINLKFDINTTDAAIETSINEYNTWSMQLFADALNELRVSASIMSQNQEEYQRLLEKVEALENLVLTTDTAEDILERIETVEGYLQQASAIIADAGDITRLIDKLAAEVIDIYNNRTSIRVAWNFDGVRGANGIKIDKTIPNVITIGNERQTYNLGNDPVISIVDDWTQDHTLWYYENKLLEGTNFLRIEDASGAEFVTDRDIILFIDDASTTWKKGQSFRLSFGTKLNLEGPDANYHFYIYTDTKGVTTQGTKYGVLVAAIPADDFYTSAGTPLYEIICVDSNELNFIVEKIR
jgi:hypothetical protein